MDSTANQMNEPYFGFRPMRAVFSDQQRVQSMLDFEAALARAQARSGLVPQRFADIISSHCQARHFDLQALSQATILAGNPAIPLIKQLGQLIAAENEEAERYLHFGATSQDVIDTGLVLQLRKAIQLFEQQLAELAGELARTARAHASTVMVGRTWLQHATPITLGMKASGWLGAITRHRQRLVQLKPRLLCLQLGGAAGTLAAMGDAAGPSTQFLSDELQLALPEQPWHTQRDRVAELAGWLGSLAGSLGKVGRDLSLLMQTEVGEVFEPGAPGKGGSSTMPHKRNPVGSAVLISAATRTPGLVATMLSAMAQEHERSPGLWHAEWDTLPELCCLVSGSLVQATQMIAGLEVNPQRMLVNLEQTQGLNLAEPLSVALAPHLGRHRAHELLEQCCREAIESNLHLREPLITRAEVMQHLTIATIDNMLDPTGYIGQATRWVENACRDHDQFEEGEP